MRTALTGVAFRLTLAAAALAGCGSGGTGGGHPDTGYGALQSVPTTETCAAYCQRQVDCVVDLCDEDSGSTNAQELASLWTTDCEALCTDSTIQSEIPSPAWSCLFTDSCRQIFGEDSCHVGARYSCTSN